jgi:hypothetical protein
VLGLSHKPNCQRANAPRQAPMQMAMTANMVQFLCDEVEGWHLVEA